MTTLDDFEYQVFRIQPGDVVVLKAAREITANEANRIRERWVAEFPHIPVVVVGPDLDLAILRGEAGEVPLPTRPEPSVSERTL